jgi:hypothetical protein
MTGIDLTGSLSPSEGIRCNYSQQTTACLTRRSA